MPGQPMPGQPMPGQPMPGQPYGPTGQPSMAQPAAHQDMRVPAQGPQMPPGPASGMQPAAYYNRAASTPPPHLSGAGAMPMGQPGYPMMEGEPCHQCGGYGCALCGPGSDDFDVQLLRWLLPYGAGGLGAPRWYDISAEWITMERDDVGDFRVFATEGVEGIPVLDTNQLDFSNESGFRVNFAIQLNAGSSLETSYMGSFNWASEALVRSAEDSLFSVYSDFGSNPGPSGFAETDQSSLQSIAYSSELHSIELNYRRRWAGPNVRFQGSWLFGVRYLYMPEDFVYHTQSEVNSAGSNTLVSTMNSMTGAQLGGDVWLTVMPGLRLGTEAKAGIYGNHATNQTTISATATDASYFEEASQDGAAFAGDLAFTLLWKINQQWTFRTGYRFLWLGEVALASDNFNSEVPLAGFLQPREPVMRNNSEVLYHGYTAGFEYMW
jgi:hypothetical protein